MARWDPWRGCRRCSTHFIKDGRAYTLQTWDLCRQARLAGINYTCEAGEKSHELQDHR